jgi:hypothetical protein
MTETIRIVGRSHDRIRIEDEHGGHMTTIDESMVPGQTERFGFTNGLSFSANFNNTYGVQDDIDWSFQPEEIPGDCHVRAIEDEEHGVRSRGLEVMCDEDFGTVIPKR